MSLPISLLPSLPAKNFQEHLDLVRSIGGELDELQVDLVDGLFAPMVSWPCNELDPHEELMRLKEFPTYLKLEMDCMVYEPEQYLNVFIELNVSKVIIHFGSTKYYRAIIKKLHGYDIEVGLAFTNDVVINELRELIEQFDFVQVMGIKSVGSQGQPFDQRTLKTIKIIRTSYPDMTIAVDGAVNHETIPLLRGAGANRFAPGSAIAAAADPQAAYRALLNLAIGG